MSVSSSIEIGGGNLGSATISSIPTASSDHLTRSRGNTNTTNRVHSTGLHRRPLSLADTSLASSSTLNTADINATTATTSNSIFRTLPSSKKIKKSKFENSFAQNTATALPSGHFLGRVLNEDDRDEQIKKEICCLAKRFQSAFTVINSPSLSAVLINYLLVQNLELAPTLLYLVARHYYWMQTHNKELAKDYQRIFMEIYTTFLHEKSPLYVKVDSQIIQQMEDKISSGESAPVFEKCLVAVLPQIQVQVDKLSKDIRHGLDTWKPNETFDLSDVYSTEEELSVYDMLIGPRVSELQRIIAGQTPLQAGSHLSTASSLTTATSAVVAWLSATALATETPREQIAVALCASLVSAYKYFIASTASMSSSFFLIQPDIPINGAIHSPSSTCPSTPSPVQHSLRRTLFTKSIENLATVPSQDVGGSGSGPTAVSTTNWDKLPSFNAKLKSKSSNAIFGSWKPKHSQKGHVLQERIFDRTVECAACGGLIWGLAPQGFSCQACDVSMHYRCKTALRNNCTKDSKSSGAIRGTISNVAMKTSSEILSNTAVLSDSCSGSLNYQSSSSPYVYTLEPANASAENFTSPSEDTKSSGGSSSLVASAEDISYCHSSNYNEVIEESAFGSTFQNSPFPFSDKIVSHATDELADLKRSNSGLGRIHHYSGSQTGLTSPESSSRYTRNIKQKFDSQSYCGTAAALSKHTYSLMQLPITSDRDLKRSIGSQNIFISTSAAANVPELLPSWTKDPEMNVSESFEAETELRIHFPDYEIPTKGPHIQDHVRTLVLLEFHQKVRYMVCYLKQFDYLLLQRWPKEHQWLVDLMALDRIPLLIQLFRSLVNAIEQTLEPQGYGKMAEAVLTWMSKDDEVNLKGWIRDCQALSCTNMLDSVKGTVREYARKHPDIQPVLETRFNKFVLIENLSQVRILYFNLPLISINIMRDLEKKTQSYKAEAKIWKEIHFKLASIPHSIDKICMPLVKLINDGHFFSTVDKGDQLTRHKAQGGNLPYANLLLQFPRTLFQHWVIDHVEIAVDKLTFTSDNKVNYDYVKERTEFLAILLDSSLILLAKDGGRYGLRPFKPSKEPGMENLTASPFNSTQSTVAPNLLGNTMKLSPVFSTDSVFTSLGEQIGHDYMLNMIFKEQAILLRLSFGSKETRERWLKILKKREEISNQNRLATLKACSSPPPVSTSSTSDLKNEPFKTIDASEEAAKAGRNLSRIEKSNLSLDISSPEAIKKYITDFTEKISEMEHGLQILLQSISNRQSIGVNKIFETLSLRSDDTVSQCNRELIVVELLLTERWLQFVKKHLRQFLRTSKWTREKSAETALTEETSKATHKKGHQRSKSAFVVSANGLTYHKRRSRTRSGSIHRDYVEQALSETSLSECKKVISAKNEEDLETAENAQLIETIHSLQNLVKTTSLIASGALSNLGTRDRKGETDSKSDDHQSDAFVDANSSLSSTSSSSSLLSVEAIETRWNDFRTVEKTSFAEIFSSEYQVDDKEAKLQKRNPKSDKDLIVSNTSFTKEENMNQENAYEEKLKMVALQIADDTIDFAAAYEMDLSMIASDLTNSAVASAIAEVMDSRRPSSELTCTTDSGISFLKIPGNISSGEDDELTVIGSKPHAVSTPTETGEPVVPFSDLDKLDPSRSPSPIAVSVGRNDSQKSTTSSGYLGSGDEIVHHDWI